MQNVACPMMTVAVPNRMPQEVLNAALSAMPVTMPGSAIGRITRKLTVVAPEEPVALHRERGHRAEHQGDRGRAEPDLDAGPQRRARPVAVQRPCHHSSVNAVGGQPKVLEALNELTSTTSSGT